MDFSPPDPDYAGQERDPPEVNDPRRNSPRLKRTRARRVPMVMRHDENPVGLYIPQHRDKINHFIRYSLIFVLRVFLLMPRVLEALSWFPPVSFSTIFMRAFSTSDITES